MRILSFVNRETVLYGLFGLATSVLNVGSFRLLVEVGLDYRVSNVIALIVTKVAAYVLNKAFVFHSNTPTIRAFLSEFVRYTVTRGGTLVFDYFALIALVDLVGMDKTIAKIATTAVVIVLNYVFGKFCVFTGSSSSKS